MKYIQSFYQYPVLYSAIGKEIPSRNAEGELRNILAVEDKELEVLETSEPLFRSLINEKKYRVLDKLPASYKPSATLVNEAREEAGRLAKENEELRAKLEGSKPVEVKSGTGNPVEVKASESKASEGKPKDTKAKDGKK